jgi:mono/diheme cytochrome c family protein
LTKIKRPAPLWADIAASCKEAGMNHAMPIVLGAALIAAATGSDGADQANGRAVAQRICGECHAVDASGPSPHAQAPAFPVVANAPGRTATSLRVWFQSPHRSMPDFHLGEKDSNDLIAYILSMRRSG